MCKFVTGLLTKLCKLFSGRDTCIGGTTGKSTLDTDNDNLANCIDEDDDNDGVLDSDDCNPLDSTVLDKTNWYADKDGDGYGDVNSLVMSCDKPTGYVSDNSDECPNQIDRQNGGDCGCSVPLDACFDCKGAPFGTAFVDSCKLCVSTITESCETDCFGEWGGTAFLDSCKTCAGGNTGKLPITNTAQCVATGLEEYQSTSYWKVSPNPSEGQFNFELLEQYQIIIFNAEGKEVYRALHAGSFSLGENFNTGIYFVRMVKEGKIETIKLIKN